MYFSNTKFSPNISPKICLECIECHITMDFYFRLRYKSLSPLDPDPPVVLAQNLKFVCLSFLLI